MRGIMKIKTPAGYMIVEEKGTEDEYPGIYVSFSKDGKGKDIGTLIATVEYDSLSGVHQTVAYAMEQDEATNVVVWETGVDKCAQ